MPSLYIFTKFPRVYAPSRFREEAEKKGLEVRVIPYKKISLSVERNHLYAKVSGEDLMPPDYAIFRSPGRENQYLVTQQGVFKWLLAQKTRVLNYRTITRDQQFDKLSQHVEFARAGLPHIPSEIFMDLTLLVDAIREYPVIMKSFTGSHGDKVRKIEKTSDILFFEKTDAPILIQPFLRVGRDVRVIVVGDQAIGAMARIAKPGKYLTNFSAGGDVEEFDLKANPEVKTLAESAAKQFECEYAGVDLMQDDDGNWLLLELNRFCEFQGFEQSTSVNVAEKTVEYLVSS